jgi:nicotinamidase-related amidase
MTTVSSPPQTTTSVPLCLDDFLRPDRVALIMWDMQNGLAGRALNIDTIKRQAAKLIEAAERRSIPVIWSRHILPPLELTTGLCVPKT